MARTSRARRGHQISRAEDAVAVPVPVAPGGRGIRSVLASLQHGHQIGRIKRVIEVRIPRARVLPRPKAFDAVARGGPVPERAADGIQISHVDHSVLVSIVAVCTEVRHPQFPTVQLVGSREKQLAVNLGDRSGVATTQAFGKIRHHHRSRFGPVRGPQFISVNPVIGAEIKRPVHVRQGKGIAPIASRPDVLHARTVPASVPSLFHSSRPLVPPSATK